ncbi:MAG: TIGR02587 family membrane protein [Rhodovulum sulfidophilum]|uniref:TIGR02587 family membrane protein n=1 Tax=Rhodovulum sulfidophilum TaxID=35806 RepID=A0A2W5PM14_RHOSU|nr:MAG: TIGR02587 family membrane protein [Rhodovulum sulfidophilum]
MGGAPNRAIRDLGRGAGGALLFSLPMLMTMEFWWLGIYLDRPRLLVLLLVAFPLLVLLSRRIGFEPTRRWRDDVIDACVAAGIAAIVCVTSLTLFGTIARDTALDEALGKIAIQMVPAAIGALLARSQFGARTEDDGQAEEPAETYGGELFLMAVGALFLGFNVAPTEEMMLISYQMSDWHALALLGLSLAIMQGFVFALGFAGGTEISPDERWWSSFLRLTLPGYVIALGISLFLLWIFGRTDGLGVHGLPLVVVVLAFPASVGAAAARLIL